MLETDPRADEGEGRGAVDAAEIVSANDAVDAVTGDVVYVRGWAASSDGSPPQRVVAAFAGRAEVEGVCGLPRPDVAAATGIPALGASGFAVALPIDTETRGQCTIAVRFTAPDAWFTLPKRSAVRVRDANELVPGYAERHDGWAWAVDGVYVGGERVAATADELWLRPDEAVFVRGWCVNRAGSTVAEVFAFEDGAAHRAVSGIARPDVEANLALPGVTPCGFSIAVRGDRTPLRTLSIVALDGVTRTRREIGRLRIHGMPALSSHFERAGVARGAIDDVSVVRHAVIVRGWAETPGPAALTVVVDDVAPFYAQSGIARDDVAAAMGDPALSASGFIASIPRTALQPGRHAFSVRVAVPGGDRAAEAAAALADVAGQTG